MRRTKTTLADLRGENAFVIMGTVDRLLKQLERAIPELKGLSARYREEAMSGDYLNLCSVTERYCQEHLSSTLPGEPGDLTALHDEELHWHE